MAVYEWETNWKFEMNLWNELQYEMIKIIK